MNRKLTLLSISLLVSSAIDGSAALHYVNVDNSTPMPPYTNWATAAATIQSAVDAAGPGDEVLVTNGIYRTGGHVVYGAISNRVAVTKILAVRSVNGPVVTVIEGSSPMGDDAVRCVYLANGAALIGFTLTNGSTLNSGDLTNEQSGGGVWCNGDAIISNCVFVANTARAYGGGMFGGTVYGSTFISNSAPFTTYTLVAYGGAVYGGRLDHCTLTGNSGEEGAGAAYSTLNNCTLAFGNSTGAGAGAIYSALTNCSLTGNVAQDVGGGAYFCDLDHCQLKQNSGLSGGGANGGTLSSSILVSNLATGTFESTGSGGGANFADLKGCKLLGNRARFGGGAANGTLNGCVLINNSVSRYGGGLHQSKASNCLLLANSAVQFGGGAINSTLWTCTVVENSAGDGGGAYTSFATNSIIYFNSSASANENYYSTSLENSCTTPASAGTGNITNPPMFIDMDGQNLRLQSNSPCINAGNNMYVTAGNDLDGRPRIAGPGVDIGAYEFQAAGVGEFIGWLQAYDLPTDGSADYLDTDGDLHNNWQEWHAQTVPTDASSVLKMLTLSNDVSSATVSWQSVSGVKYFLQRSADLGATPAFLTVISNVVGQAGFSSYTDTNSASAGESFFYRVGVQ